MAWHPNGQRLATAGGDGRRRGIKVWDARDGRELLAISAGQDYFSVPFTAVAFSPDGHYLVTGKVNGAVQVWDAETGREVVTLGTHSGEPRGMTFSRDGRHLASAADGEVILWDATRLTEKQEPRITIRGRVPGPSLNVAFSPDGRTLVTGGEQYTVKLWEVQTGRELATLRGHGGDIYTVAFSPDGRWIASAGEDSTVKVWDAHNDYRLVRSFRGHTGVVASLTFASGPDGLLLVSGSRDHTVKVWDVSKLAEEPKR
jgi:WD40 repeat protein